MKRVLVDFERCMGCHTCELACATAHSEAGTFIGAVLGGERPPVSIKVVADDAMRFPLQCRHCTEAPCAKACMVHALTRDEATGRVTCDTDRCIGCMMCVMVCPFGAISESPETHKAAKCDLCMKAGEPACVDACPTGALSFEEVDGFSARRRKEFVVNYDQCEGALR